MKVINLIICIAFASILISCEKEVEFTPYIIYPESGFYGENALDTSKVEMPEGFISLAAELSEDAELKIVITSLNTDIWYYKSGSSINWAITDFDQINKTQTFYAVNDDSKCDLSISFVTKNFKIEYYEMGSEEPSFTKIFE